MNYKKHYDTLINRSPKTKPENGYYEKHRIVPGCMGGTYSKQNIVFLLPEEHYVAHQLLYKIYKTQNLLYAARMMATHNSSNRSKNKEYSWLRKLFSENHPCKAQEVRDKISKSLKKYYERPGTREVTIDSLRAYKESNECKIELYTRFVAHRETRSCLCGCGKTFYVLKSDKRRYFDSTHAPKNYELVGITLSNTILSMSPSEQKSRLDNSIRKCDNIKRGNSISKGKKGKSTNQQEIMGRRYAAMDMIEFENFVLSKNKKMQNRIRNLRKKYENK